jgi:hypothetical protein
LALTEAEDPSMRVTGVARLLLYRAVWRTTGLRSAGRALVRALGADDADERTIAGMSLVQAGGRAVPLLREALARRENVPLVLTLLGDIGDPSVEGDLLRLAHDPDATISDEAREALRVLEARRQRP